jgi:hypothetical protein
MYLHTDVETGNFVWRGWLPCPRPTKTLTKSGPTSPIALSHFLAGSALLCYNMDNCNGNCAYADGFPRLAEGLGVVMLGPFPRWSTLSLHIPNYFVGIEYTGGSGRRKTWRPVTSLHMYIDCYMTLLRPVRLVCIGWICSMKYWSISPIPRRLRLLVPSPTRCRST